MKNLSLSDLRSKGVQGSGSTGKVRAMERIRKFREADEKVKQVCAGLGIDKPQMIL